MNTYNDNLRASVVESLDSQELQTKKMKSQYNASMFNLYYAQGARVKAAEKLEIAKDVLEQKAMVKEQAVKNNNISTNVLMAANQEKTYVEKSVSNAAVCAANIQVATTAIVRLASDIASINSIANVADYKTEISNPYHDVFKLISTTAYNAEYASQLAMEASELTASISSNAVNSIATVTDASVKDLLKTASSQFDLVSQTVAADNETLATSNTKEKSAEGKLEDTFVDYEATIESYEITNDELNLNLTVDKLTPTGYNVNFDLIKSSFKKPASTEKLSSTFFELVNPPMDNPVTGYYVILVKEEKKSTVSLAFAEHIYQDDFPYEPNKEKRFFPIKLPVEAPVTRNEDTISCTISLDNLYDTDKEKVKLGFNYVIFIVAEFDPKYKKALNNFEDYISAASLPFTLTHELESPNCESFCYTETYDVKNISAINTEIKIEEAKLLNLEEQRNSIQSEIRALKQKNKYLTETETLPADNKKKKEIKDRIAARIKLTESLETNLNGIIGKISPQEAKIKTAKDKLTTPDLKIMTSYDGCSVKPQDPISIPEASLLEDATFSFSMLTSSNNSQDGVEYRCMFLPNDKTLINDLINTEGLINVEKSATLIKTMQSEFNNKIKPFENEIAGFESEIEMYKTQIISKKEEVEKLEASINDSKTSATNKTKLQKKINELVEQIANHYMIIVDLQSKKIPEKEKEMNEVISKEIETIANISFNVDNDQGGIFFNEVLAEQVSAGNYSIAKPVFTGLTISGDIDEENGNNKRSFQVKIKPDTTDNYGTPLILHNDYVPVVFAVSKLPESKSIMYTSSISNIMDTPSFTYGRFTKKQ
ncbi:hypothetical protein [Psychroserpens sp.]|uniref:hypothetical protein n=1 Tax=Psychroserpens sp. TaxID=2020870 RepID=UPI002B272AEB|nr:hypothetical protein [Psychroserpens sp.]